MDPSPGMEVWTHGDTVFHLSGSTRLFHTHTICIPTSSVGAPTPQIFAHTCCCRCFLLCTVAAAQEEQGPGRQALFPLTCLPLSQASRPM